MPLLKDERFRKDREDFTGRRSGPETQARGRPEAVLGMREAASVLENEAFADGRQWVGGKEGPGVADIEGMIFLSLFLYFE